MSTPLLVSYVALWLLATIEGVLLFLVYRHFGLTSMATAAGHERDGLPIGESAPAISGLSLGGKQITRQPEAGRAHILVFGSPDCQPCRRILPSLNRLAVAKVGADLTLVIWADYQRAMTVRDLLHEDVPCVVEVGTEAVNAYRVKVAPFAFVIGKDGRIRQKGVCSDSEKLQRLIINAGLPDVAAVLDSQVVADRRSERNGGKQERLSAGSGSGHQVPHV